MVSSPHELVQNPGELLKEVYDRLDQIYGFPHFNYPTLRKDDTKIANSQSDDDGMLWKDFLSSGSTSSSTGTSPLDAFLQGTATTTDTLSMKIGIATSMDGETVATTTTYNDGGHYLQITTLSTIPCFTYGSSRPCH